MRILCVYGCINAIRSCEKKLYEALVEELLNVLH